MRFYFRAIACWVSIACPVALFAQEPIPVVDATGVSNAMNPGTTNPIADPFAATVRRIDPPTPLNRATNAGDYPVPTYPVFPALPAALPQGLRVAMIRSGGYGLLISKDTGSSLIPVKHKGTVRLSNQTYYAEVDDNEIRLMSGPKGKLLWIGTLDGSLGSMPTANTNQQGHFEPPLSAGVNPGLKSSHSNSDGSGNSPTAKP